MTEIKKYSIKKIQRKKTVKKHSKKKNSKKNKFSKKGGVLELNDSWDIDDIDINKNFVESSFEDDGYHKNGFNRLWRGYNNEIDILFKLLVYFGLFRHPNTSGKLMTIEQSKCKDIESNILVNNINKVLVELNATVLGSGSFGPTITYNCDKSGELNLLIKIPYPQQPDQPSYKYREGRWTDASQEIINNIILASSITPFITQFRFSISLKNKNILFGNKNGNIVEWSIKDWLLRNDTGVPKSVRDYFISNLDIIDKSDYNGNDPFTAIAMEKAEIDHKKYFKNTNTIYTNNKGKLSFNNINNILKLYDCNNSQINIIWNDNKESLWEISEHFWKMENSNDYNIISKGIEYYIPYLGTGQRQTFACILTFILEILLGLYHIHIKGFVHCDLHSGNMVFAKTKIPSGRLRSEIWQPYISQIIDFGLSKPNGIWLYNSDILDPKCEKIENIPDEYSVKDYNTIPKTNCWGAKDTTPPELNKDGPVHISGKGDIYSLGKYLKHLFSFNDNSDSILESIMESNNDFHIYLLFQIIKMMLIEDIASRPNTNMLINLIWDSIKLCNLEKNHIFSQNAFIIKNLYFRGIKNESETFSYSDNKNIFINNMNYPDKLHEKFIEHMINVKL